MKEASSIVLYSGPISIKTFLKEWNADPWAYILCWYTCQLKKQIHG